MCAATGLVHIGAYLRKEAVNRKARVPGGIGGYWSGARVRLGMVNLGKVLKPAAHDKPMSKQQRHIGGHI